MPKARSKGKRGVAAVDFEKARQILAMDFETAAESLALDIHLDDEDRRIQYVLDPEAFWQYAEGRAAVLKREARQQMR